MQQVMQESRAQANVEVPMGVSEEELTEDQLLQLAIAASMQQ